MTEAAGAPLLEIEDLSVGFGDGRALALSGISFALRRNEILGIVGETGAGKSVLARAMIDLLPEGGRVTGGDIRIEGRSILAMNAEDQRALRGGRISLIGTNPKALLDPVRTVGAQLVEVLRAHRKCSRVAAKRAAIDLLGRVGIAEPGRRMTSYPHELSGGMAQRVVIGLAMIAEPDVILADDATLGLDATIQVQVLDLLVDRCRDLNVGVILITHDLGIVARYCERVAIMQAGRIIEISPVADFLRKPQERASATLLAAARVRPTPMSSGTKPKWSDNPLLEVRDLFKSFPISGTREVVRAVVDVSFSVGRGQTLALVGESGSGKTTVGQCLVRLLSADSGRIVFDGKDITSMPARAFRVLRKRIQMVFQEPYVALNPRWSVQDLIAEPLALLEGSRTRTNGAKVRELLELVHLPASLMRSYPHQLTAGEQKRVGIARALATGPDFVVFDEPTTALDIRVRAQIIDLVRELQRRMGLSALFITHDLNSVRSLAHSVAVMQNGRIVESGETEAIFANPQQDYTRVLLAAELPIEAETDASPAGRRNADSVKAARADTRFETEAVR